MKTSPIQSPFPAQSGGRYGGGSPSRRPLSASPSSRGKEPPKLFRTFGEFLDYFLAETDMSQGRVAQLAGLHTYTINKILHGHGVSESVMLRIMISMLQLQPGQLEFVNVGLAAAGSVALPAPGRTIPSHEEHARLKRGSVRGKRFGNRTTEAARLRDSA